MKQAPGVRFIGIEPSVALAPAEARLMRGQKEHHEPPVAAGSST